MITGDHKLTAVTIAKELGILKTELALTGEEKGLLGSQYYTDNPLVPLYKTVADINIDGVAMFRDFESVVGIGSEFSTLESYLDQTALDLNLVVENVPPEFNQSEAFNQSDQVSFAIAGIPSMLVLEGLKNKAHVVTPVGGQFFFCGSL